MGRERRQMVPNKILSLSHLALIVILVIIINAFTTYASPLEPYKRGRSASSSLIPFPRVGRSVSEPLQGIDSDQNDEMLSQRSSRSASKSQFYGQKRTAMEGDSERFVYPREFETLQLIQSLLRE